MLRAANLKSFLIGALCGAVVFAIIDRLVQSHERQRALDEKAAPVARAAGDSLQKELQGLTEPAPLSAPPPDSVASSEEIEENELLGEDQLATQLEQRNQSPQPSDDEAAKAKQADEDDAAQPAPPSAAAEKAPEPAGLPDDAAWGPYMEQTLRQFLAGHPSAPKFDVLSIGCSSGQCEIQAAGFDESTWPVWQQVMYDLRQQPWYEFGEAGSSAGRPPEYDGRFVLRTKLKRLPRQ